MSLSRASLLSPLALLRACSAPRAVVARRWLSTEEATTAPAATTVVADSAASAPAQPRLRYHVERTMSSNFPIYKEAKRGGNLKQTRLRKIHGDVQALRSDIQEALGLDKDIVKINDVTKHIIIKGWYKPELIKFLSERKF